MIELLAQFHFIRPLALLAAPIIVLMFFYLQRRNSATQGWQQSIDPDLLLHLIDKPEQTSRSFTKHYPLRLATLISCLAIIALAGPSFEKLPQPPLRQQQTLVIIADLTLSMHAEDLKPSRLVRMRYKLLELLKQRREGQTALIAYSGDAHIVSPLTDDSATIAALVPALKPEIMPQIGSNAGAAFELAEQLLGSGAGSNKVVWFTDGFHTSDQRALKALTKAHKITLIIVGVGTTDGAPVRLPSGKFLKGSSEQIVKPRLDKRGFKKLATQLGGRYIDLQNDNSDVDYILSDRINLNAEFNAIEEAGYQFDQWLDRGAWLLLFITPFAALAFRRGWLLGIAFIAFGMQSNQLQANALDEPATLPIVEQQSTSFWQDLWLTPDQRAARLYQQGQLQEAQQFFEDNNWKGVSAYQQQDYKAAQDAFQQSIESGEKHDTQSLANAHYNGGHALARSGNLKKAIAAYDEALALAPDFDNAKQARALVEKLLSDQQQSQPDSDQQSEQQSGQESDQQQSKQQQSNSEQSEQPQSSSEQQQQNSSDEQSSPDTSEGQQSDAQQQSTNNEPLDEPETSQQQSDKDSAEESQQALTMTMPDGQPMDPEQAAALEQWLNKIKDDPAGLLRRKFQYERQQRERSGDVVQPDEEGSIW